jgi:ankyrin repeat protein
MQALRTSAFDYEQFKDRNPDRLKGTCQWVLRHENFRNWKDSSSSSLLWVSADPGCGKSVLSKSLIDQDFKSSETLTTCYFFFKDDNDEQKKATTALSALLHQLFSQKPTLIDYAMSEDAINGDKLTRSFHTLWSILTKAVADPKAGEIFCILDALDECAEVGRYQIINAVSVFYQASSRRNASRLKFFVTSRPYLDIERRFTDLISNFPMIRLQGEQESYTISREIDIVIKWRVSNLGSELKLNNSETSNLEIELLGMTHRTYLWLTLILDIIRKTIRPTSRKLKAIISTLPSTVEKAYEAILSRIEKDERLQVRKLLHIIVAAARPFTLKELNIALAIEDHKSYKDLDLDDEARFDSTIRNICGLFVTVIDQKVYLIHQTAKEFLVAKNEVLDGWKHSLDPVESELVIARTCISYLMFDEFGDGLVSDSTSHNFNIQKQTGSRGYLNYAAEFWAMHYRKAQERATSKIIQSALKICEPRSRMFRTWFHTYWKIAHRYRPIPRFISSMMVASYFGHDTVVEQLLESGTADVDSKGENGRTPLSYTAENGHEAVVKLLLSTDQVEADSEYDRTALSCTAFNTYYAVMKLLIEGKSFGNLAEGNIDDDVRTAFLYYAENGLTNMFKLLVGDNLKKRGRTPLSYAAGNGHEGVVELLLETGKIEVNSVDQDIRTPLSYAAENGHKAVVKLLLETGEVDVDFEDDESRTPLSYIAGNGNEAMVKLLLETGEVEVDFEDNESRTPLSYAAGNGNEAMVKLLLETGEVDIDSKDNESRTPLSHAAENGREIVVKLLLESKADVDSKDHNSRTPIWWAAGYGCEAVVKLLLATGRVDVDLKDNDSQTPMSTAVKGGHEGVVKLLQSFSSE